MKAKILSRIILEALTEDIGTVDITTELLVRSNQASRAYIVAKQNGVICGLKVAKMVFEKLDPAFRFRANCSDGTFVKPGQKIADLSGKTRAILGGERVALNFLSLLSGIATTTSRYVQAIRPYPAKIYDTRKTTPGLRWIERMAVKAGGGNNHRFDLSEMVLVKDNHHAATGSALRPSEMVHFLRNKTRKPICIEVTTLAQLKETLKAGCEIILLDNMNTSQLKKSVQFCRKLTGHKRPLLEASGGVTLRNVRSVARSGVDRISIGALTHSFSALDFSLEMTP